MASSTSSERAFSSAGITITKRRNRLKADIVEALQYLKSQYHSEIIFRESPSSLLEERMHPADQVALPSGAQCEEMQGWDSLLPNDEIEHVDDEGEGDEDDVYVPSLE